MTTLSFPNELLLQIYPHLSLKTLISAQGVDKLWRHLVPLADLDPTRRHLLELFARTISSPVFLRSRPWVLANLRPFDREAYITALLTQHNHIPQEFRMWILEWPEKAVVGCAWPGLPEAYCGTEADDIERRWGFNLLGRVPPLVHTVRLTQPGDVEDLVEEDVPGLLTWQLHDKSWVWVILDERPILRGKVYDIRGARYNTQEEANNNLSNGRIHSTWIEWQYHLLQCIEQRAQFLDNNPGLNPFRRVSHFTFQCGISQEQWAKRLAHAHNRLWSVEHSTSQSS